MPRTLFTSKFVRSTSESLSSLMSLEKVVFMAQVHGDVVVEVDAKTDSTPRADALVTRSKGVGVAVLTADCLPILVDGLSVVGAIHAGRKGLTNGVIRKTIFKMRELGGTKFSATIGPAICALCYEVENSMYQEIVSQFPSGATTPELHSLNLAAMAAHELRAAGVLVKLHEVCTKENLDFNSHRRGRDIGRQVGVIAL